MEKQLYISILEKTKSYNKATKAIVERHVEYLRRLDDDGKLELCGVSKGYPGVAGMIILRTENFEEAKEICAMEPFGVEGLVTHKLSTLQVADRENNYLL